MSQPTVNGTAPDITIGCTTCPWTEHATDHLEGWLRYFRHTLEGCTKPAPPRRTSWWRRLLRSANDRA